MSEYIRDEALLFLQNLEGQHLGYGIKSPDMDLYDFGFGDYVGIFGKCGKQIVCKFTLHITCEFKIIYRNEHRTERYTGSTSSEIFHTQIQAILERSVKRVGLSDKNDLWLDFGDIWMVFITFENAEESWRFFAFEEGQNYTSVESRPHLVASDAWIEYQ